MDGWEPAEITDYEYDDVGKLTRSITLREPEFNDIDVVELLAFRELQRETGRYGESLAEAFSEQANPNYTGSGAIRYVAKWRVNEAEAAVERERKALGEELPAGVTWYVEENRYD